MAVLGDIRLMPVVVIDDVTKALPLAETLIDAGIRAIEFTLRTEAGFSSLERVARAMPEVLVGAGSVRDVEQLAMVRDAGARFAISPGYTDALLDAAEGFPYVPGAVTASESMHLLARGYRLQKFFPAELSGGVEMIRALSAPLPEVRFCVTGGITPQNVGAYLACPSVACIGGSWFVPGRALAVGEFAAIGRLCREAVAMTVTVP